MEILKDILNVTLPFLTVAIWILYFYLKKKKKGGND